MRTVVIGGTGHIGTYLVPALVRLGHQVTVLSRGERTPYQSDGAWQQVELVQVDRAAEDAAGTFGQRVVELSPDVVIDLICFTEDSARQLAEAVQGRIQHLLHCGTIWVHGPSMVVPTREDTPRRPFGDYGVQKAAIETYLLGKARRDGLPVTIVHPGHICGPGWTPVNPAGNFDLGVYDKLAQGADVLLPNLGLETLNPVHADDVAGVFLAAIASRSTAIGESFHAVASDAVTLRGYAEAVATRFGQKARLGFLPIGQLQDRLPKPDGQATWDHVLHSPNCSMAKAERLLGFRPRYSAVEAALAGIDWLVDAGKITTT
ncbi:NAD-dependent epimerase/dehydratase family protein [Kribbella jiaozuonensis]|uniref:NAD-dependent epimerase/dehydratase family protein n=1 Tax=Kribbella jiaozuonensis TaxID=2575441 RepID=A0A4U3LRL7_9ACTN|nr:NAD-dependent epimerase/dehydratase family protein [Kribbella jiaozuonensis]TKK78362.1 NAD-dependent epimerase/dehydratase family protein [Kribbella jiaozuonensis]